MNAKTIDRFVRQALEEDAASADITTLSTIPAALMAEAVIVVREPAVVCGLEFVQRAVAAFDKQAEMTFLVKEGAKVKAGASIMRIRARARAIVTPERVALNFLGRLSAIATLTRSFVDAVKGTKAVILDTRKTTPLLRCIERYAVGVGGGVNHRFDLSEMVLVKDNHRFLSHGFGSLAEMVKTIRRQTKKPIEVEVDSLEELEDVLNEPPEMILLDNMSAVELRKAVQRVSRLPHNKRPLLEASGGITLKNVRAAALCGVDRISVGAITHSACCVDVSMEIRKVLND